MIEDGYRKDNYDTNLLVTQLRPINDIFNVEKITMYIIDRKEHLDNTKKLIEHFLHFMVSENFNLIMNELKRSNDTDCLIMKTVDQCKAMKEHSNKIREHYLISSLKLALKRQKMKNIKLIYDFIANYLLKWMKMIKDSEEEKKEHQYSSLFKNLGLISNDIDLWCNNNNITKKQNLIITDVLQKKIKNKMQLVKEDFDNVLNKIFFDNKVSLDNDIYMLFCTVKIVQFQNPIEEFYNSLLRCFKMSILITFKEMIGVVIKNTTFDSNIQQKDKFSQFKHIKLNEYQIMTYIPLVFKKLLIIAQSFNIYMDNKNNENTSEIKQLLYNKREQFSLIFEKKVCKVLQCLYYNIPSVNNSFNSKNNFLLFLTYINLFSECLKFYFKVNEFKHINNFLISIVKSQLDANIKVQIRKSGIMLSGDLWKRIALQDNNEIFIENTNKPFLIYKKLLPFFNKEGKDYLTSLNHNKKQGTKQKTIVDFFIQIVENPDKVINLSYFEYEQGNTIKLDPPKVFKKQLDNSKLILSSSSFALIKSIMECINELLLYDVLSNEIYLQIFNLFDYYILAAVNMFMIQKAYFAQIFKTVDIEEIRKKNTLSLSYGLGLFLESHMHLRKHFNHTKRNLSLLYNGATIDFLSPQSNGSDESDTKSLYFPKINSQVFMIEKNIYFLLIESIILYESIISIYKYIKNINYYVSKETKSQVEEKLKSYKDVLNELKSFLYKPLCGNIISMNLIIEKMQNQKWDIENLELLDCSQASPFINTLLEEMIEKYDNLTLLSGGSLTTKSQVLFFDVFISFVIDTFLYSVSIIKKSTSAGRSVLLRDIKFLKQKLEEYFADNKKKMNINKYFNKLLFYVNSWYNRENEFIQYIKESKIEYRYAIALVNYGDYFSKMGQLKRSELISKIDAIYYGILNNINHILINEMD